MLWRERRRRLASARANLAFSKEERDFAGSGFYRVGTVGAVLGEAVSVVSAQSTRQGVCRLVAPSRSRGDAVPHFRLPERNHDRAGGHELNQTVEERATFVLSIETTSLFNGQVQHFGADDFEPCSFKAGKDAANNVFLPPRFGLMMEKVRSIAMITSN
ncbi:Uncharacterised protein [Klebsiella pneumoniae subsp. pneumoniae]|uniref:Uncharacterized protein n=1 Tax=Klebsiella pneumoniae subsp. pneumoniae TaxID=72407 RepID=A0A377ZBW3_KLEPN|nr:Uncharacterised protein [Klebsiella pneumoniae subsp. pneumoniae]